MKTYDENQKAAFFLGTLFPDIRYIAKLSRTQTHESEVTLERIKDTQDPFLKGMRLHVFVDVLREEFLQERQVCEKLTKISGDKILSLKFLEDEILYSMRQEQESFYIAAYFDTYTEGELKFNLPSEILRQWHQLNQSYLCQRPSVFFENLMANQSGFGSSSVQVTYDTYEALQIYAEEEEFKNYVKLSHLNRYSRLWRSQKLLKLPSISLFS